MHKEYSLQPVPVAGRVFTWWHMSLIWGGISFCLPTFMIGALPVPGLDWMSAFWVNAIGNALCAVLIGLAGYGGLQTGLPSVVLYRQYFGRTFGGRVVSLALFFSTCGWFGVMLAATADGLAESFQLFGSTDTIMLTVLLGLGMTITSMIGNPAILLVNRLTVPLLMVLITYYFYQAVAVEAYDYSTAYIPTGETDFLTMLNLIIAGYIVGAVCASDFSRYAKDGQAHWIGTIIGVFAVSLFLSYIGMHSKVATGQWNPLKAAHFIGSGFISQVVIVFAAWTTNHALLYSAGLSLSSLADSRHPKRCVTMAGTIGTGLALTGALSGLEQFLTVLSYIFPALLGMFLSHIFIVAKYLPGTIHNAAGWVALFLGSAIPLFLPEGASITAGVTIGGGAWAILARHWRDK